jgi:hypothetical protein
MKTRDTATLNAPHSSADSETADQREDIDAMFSEIETMRKIRAKISRKPDRIPEEKIAICLQSIVTESATAKHAPIINRRVAKGPGKTNGRIAQIARWHIETTTPLAPRETVTVAWLVGESDFLAGRTTEHEIYKNYYEC